MAQPNVVSLESQALNAVPDDQMVKFMSDVWKSPLRHQYWDQFKSKLSLTDMSRLAKTLPWDDPAARDLDFTVHKRRMHGKSVLIFFPSSRGPYVHPLFFRHTQNAWSNCHFVFLVVGSNVVCAYLLEV